jgi:hypothetical protein
MTQFFGYWGGSLPPVTELHFRSFIYFHPNSKYDLWLDRDVGYKIPKNLEWINDHPQINIRIFSLNELVNKYVKPITQYADGPIFDALRFIHRKKLIRYLNFKNYYKPLFKINYKHSSPLFSYKRDLVYRGDLARCIIPIEYYEGSSLYADVDVCFLSDLNQICNEEGFVYRWINYDFANSAILYSPNKKTAKNILEAGNKIECFRPWYLFTNQICNDLHLKIYPANQFDAMWDSHSLLAHDATKFFKKTVQSKAMVEELFAKKYFTNHWHNNWSIIPDRGSPYNLLMKQFSI